MPKATKMVSTNLEKEVKRFGSEDACRAYLEELRWPNGPRCLRCNSDRISRIRTRHKFACNSCRYQFCVKSGTLFQNSHLPLWKWFIALYLMIESKEGISVGQLQQTLGVTRKTALSIFLRLRAATRNDPAGLLKETRPSGWAWQEARKKSAARGKKVEKGTRKGVRGNQGEARLRVIRRAKGKNPWLFRDTVRKFIFADCPAR